MEKVKKTTLWAGSHIPVLAELMIHVNKPVLELGMGYNSTPLLHWLCKAKGVPLLSLESDKKWMDKFLEFQTQSHGIRPFDFAKNDIGRVLKLFQEKDKQFGLVFIDHRPARKRRHSAKVFADVADFIVLHDSELADNPAYKYTPIYDTFKYKYEYKAVGTPHTMILSNKVDIEGIFK